MNNALATKCLALLLGLPSLLCLYGRFSALLGEISEEGDDARVLDWGRTGADRGFSPLKKIKKITQDRGKI